MFVVCASQVTTGEDDHIGQDLACSPSDEGKFQKEKKKKMYI